jgi:hypothetical protein
MVAGIRVLAFLALAGAFAVLAVAGPAAGATGCRQQVIDDWSADGRIDRVYGLDCYEAAIGALPPDIRDYTDASDEIERALTLAVRAKTGPPSDGRSSSLAAARPVATSASAGIPLSLLAFAGLAAGTLAAGALGFVSRRSARGPRDLAR